MRGITLLLLSGLWLCGVFTPITAGAQKGIEALNLHLQNQQFNGLFSTTEHFNRMVKKTNDIKDLNEFHNYVWYKNNFHFKIEGSGKVYKILGEDKFKRIDSTNFDGYNFGAFNFVYHDTIFSLGGYGFWNYNGALRFFQENTGVWNVLPTNITVPIMISRFAKPYYDIANEKIYCIYQKPERIEDLSYAKDETYYVQCLDLKSKTWWETPKLMNKSIIRPEHIYFFPVLFHTPFGMILRYDVEINLLDFNKNIFHKINQNKVDEINAKLFTHKTLLTYFLNNNLYFYYPESGLIDSISFTSNDFIKTDHILFTDINNIQKLYTNPPLFISIGSGLIVLLIIVLAASKIKRLQKRVEMLMSSHMNNGSKVINEINIANPNSFRENLTEVEKSLLDLLVSNTAKNEMTTVSQMNQVLGIYNKDTKIQNNIRSNTIQLINRKFTIYSGLSDDLIEKQRTEFDKRFFEYQIQRKYLSKVKNQK
jgi:hypothetical protein